MLIEAWAVEFKGVSRRSKPVDEWVECRIVKMFHGTVYGGAHGVGKTVDEARLNAVLGLANAICDDTSAFDHDADEIFKAEVYRWFQSKLQEIRDEQEALEGEYDNPSKGASEMKKLNRRAKLVEQLMAEWQEDYDYYPAEAENGVRTTADIARLQKLRADIDRRRAASARLQAKAASVTAALTGTDAS